MSPTYGPEIYVWAKLSSEAKPSAAYAGQRAIETDTGDIYEWRGDKNSGSWVQIDAAGARLSRPDGYDSATNTQNIIDYEHHEIHDGQSYFVDAYDSDLDTADTLIIAFKTPDTAKWFHIIPIADDTVAALFEILEGPTITNGSGSDLTIFNAERNSSNISSALNIEAAPTAGKATLNPTITADGVVLKQRALGGGSGPFGTGGESRATQEIVLKQNTIYAFRLTGLADNGAANVDLSWYEHTNIS